MVGHRTQRTRVNTRAALEDICRWMIVDRSNGAGGFRCPAIVQLLTREKVVSETVLRDTRRIFYGIAGLWFKTADSVEAVWNRTSGFLRVGATTDGFIAGRRFVLIERLPLRPQYVNC